MTKIYSRWQDYPTSKWRWPNFSPQELACRGTGRLMVVPAAMDKLQALRDRLGKPLIINSGYRSPEHNRAVGGAKGSKHMEGIAFDVSMSNHDPVTFIEAAKAVGFRAIGTYPRQNFVHVDARPNEARWGRPFPSRGKVPGFAPEAPREAESIETDSEAQGAVVGAAGAAAAGGGVLSALGSLDPLPQTIAIVGVLVALVALGYIFRKRLKRLAR